MKRVGIVLTAVLTLSACGTAPPATNVSTVAAVQAGAKHNDTDVMYLQMMVAHHEQGLEMVRMAEAKAGREDISTLVEAIDATQSDEVTLMKKWLTDWAQPTTVDHAPSAHADHGGLPATGPDEIAALKQATGTTFDTAFLNLFVAHQHNAVEMAALETTDGANPETKAFADRVRESRTDQIQQLLTMLNT
ncbi:DUF305 domain-containing protein [Actinoplanes sp. N902-109]|uniref:DUF305 domain-containing protein n=1 Tax=Actinoplanes sp. (strain N902-109) TaxID=649831 RepID=UPI00032941C6|nr:hypothetical protein L083_8023 [Actinoplanes sp. N902-109]